MKETTLAMALVICACVETEGRTQDETIEDPCTNHYDSLTCNEVCDEGNWKNDYACYHCTDPMICEDLRCDCVVCPECPGGMTWECEEPGFTCG